MKWTGLPEVSLRHLKAFVAVCETGGLRAAGSRLRRSPSAVMRSLAILEGSFGVPLVVRSSTGVAPTPEGELVLTRCRIIERELGACRDLLARSHRRAVRPEAAFFDMQIGVSHLHALIAVHDFRSVQRAARLLAVSQSAISYSMRLLRADLGIRLFLRMPQGMIATPAGVSLTLCARRTLSELSRMSDDVRSAEGVSTGLVSVGGLAYSRTALLPHAIKRTLAAHPGIVVRTVEGPINTLVTALHAGEVDAVLCARPDEALLDGVDVEPIARDPMGFFVSGAHPLAGRPAVRMEDLADYPFILPPAGSITRSLLEDFCLAAGIGRPRGRAETSSYSVVRNLLRESGHIAFRSHREFQERPSEEGILALDMATTLPERTICLLQRQDVRQTAAVRDFLDIVRATPAAGRLPG